MPRHGGMFAWISFDRRLANFLATRVGECTVRFAAFHADQHPLCKRY